MAPTPVATGTLEKTPLQHVVLSILNRQMSGTLAVWPDEEGQKGQDRVYFEDGRAVRGRLIEDATSLALGLLPLFRRRRAPYAFYEADLCGESAIREPVDTFALLAASVRGPLRDDAVDRLFALFEGKPVRFASSLVERFRLMDRETAFVDMLRAEPRPVGELVDAYGDTKVARRVLYLLALTGGLEVYTARERPSSPAETAAAARALSRRIRESTPSFGVDRRATAARIAEARNATSAPPPAEGRSEPAPKPPPATTPPPPAVETPSTAEEAVAPEPSAPALEPAVAPEAPRATAATATSSAPPEPARSAARTPIAISVPPAPEPFAEPVTHTMPAAPPSSGGHELPGLEDLPGLEALAPDAPSVSASSVPPATHSAPAAPPAPPVAPSTPPAPPVAASAPPAPLSSIVPEAPAVASSGAPATSARFSLPPSLTDGVAKPAGLSAELSARWDQVLTTAERMDLQTYYDMLGVSSTSNDKEINAAYFAQVKIWHPDRLPPELEALRGHAETIFHHLTEAQKTLLDAQLSARYRRAVQDGGGTPADERKLAKVLEAAVTFQKAEVLLRRKNWAEAAPIIDEALALRPREADYLAAKAEVLLRQKGAEGLHLKELRGLLMTALEVAPDHERALMVKAELAARRHDHAEALRLYEQVAARYPKNIDAVRQVRIARMRQGTDRSGSHEAEDAGSGLLGKLFGRKKK